jgi:hypothetical protein
MQTTPDFIQWAIGQGVAVAVLAFVLVRLDGRLTDMLVKMDTLIAILTQHPPTGGG